MGRERLLLRLDAGWRRLIDAVDALPESAQARPAVTGEWSVRQLLSHIATWEREFLKALPLILAGRRLPHYSTLYGGIDRFNALEQERTASLSLDAAKQVLLLTHADLLETLSQLPRQEPRVEARLRRRLRQDTYHHYELHAESLRGALD